MEWGVRFCVLGFGKVRGIGLGLGMGRFEAVILEVGERRMMVVVEEAVEVTLLMRFLRQDGEHALLRAQ